MENNDNNAIVRKSKIISIVNQKGGVGKTTTAVNLATALAAAEKKILLIDLDPQGNATTGFGINKSRCNSTVYEVVMGLASIDDAKISTLVPGLDLIPSTVNLSGAELELVGLQRRENQLKAALSEAELYYDYIIVDCPPSLGLLTLNALVAADSVIVPLQCEFYALEGLSHLLKTIELIKKRLNPKLNVQGVVLTMYDRRNKLSLQIEADVRGFLGKTVYETIIPRNVRISEAPSHGKPALLYDFSSTGARAYAHLASEMINQEKRMRAA